MNFLLINFYLVFFPLDLIENGLSASNFAVLGSCNLILLGIFIAVLLRFDNRLMRGTNFYFNVTTAAFALGLVASMLVEHSYHQAQSALLYLAPICLGTPLFMAVCRGDVKAMFR